MSIQVDSKLLAAAVKALGITVPIRSARVLADGRVLVFTRDGRRVWEPPKKETVVKSVSKPRASRKRVPRAKKEVASEADD